MPYLTKRFIHYYDHDTHFIRTEDELDKPEYFQLESGGLTCPKGTNSLKRKSATVPSPLFIKNSTKTVDNVGQYGSIYIIPHTNMIFKNVYVEPKEVVTDISYFTDKTGTHPDRLLYSFYNPTHSDIVSIWAITINDAGEVLSKIKSNSDDLEYRMYILKTTLSNSSVKDFEFGKITFPENMTAAQVAIYLQVKEKTIRNWTSEGKIPVAKLPTGTVRYRFSEIENWVKKKK